jgi:osmotically-inducible protein OsmY
LARWTLLAQAGSMRLVLRWPRRRLSVVQSSLSRRQRPLDQALGGFVMSSHPVAKARLALLSLCMLLSMPMIAPAADSSAAIRAQTLIETNSLLSGYSISVLDEAAGLRLEGAVADPSERALAADLAALIDGSGEIDNAIRVDADLPSTMGRLYTADKDLTTLARLRQTLSWQKDTAGLGIAVEVNRGEVRLNGDVGTTTTKDRIAALAKTTEGVDEVFNYISVDPARIPAIREQQRAAAEAEHSDDWIAARLRRLLRFDTTVNSHSIDLEVREGRVILSGSVTSSAERKVAESLAEGVPGVRGIESRLIIDRPR